MGFRRKGREYALQVLFGTDLTAAAPAAGARRERDMAEFWAQRRATPEVRAFAESLIRGVDQHRGDIDALVARHATHWTMDRMATVDRNVLRLAVYELLYALDVPDRVVLNEAIEIAKKYGTDESGAFVNGILDHIIKHDPAVPVRRGAERTHAVDGPR
ncbi:MAG: transcription antitermination factor NusB [Nitrospirota bacterium]